MSMCVEQGNDSEYSIVNECLPCAFLVHEFGFASRCSLTSIDRWCAVLLRPYVAQRLITDSDTRINKARGLGRACHAVFCVLWI